MDERVALFRRLAADMRQLEPPPAVDLFGPALTVTCSDQSHADAVPVATLFPSNWYANTDALLVDDVPVGTLAEALLSPSPVRSRFRLQCPACGLTVEFRAERAEMLHKFAELGVSQVDLYALGRYLQ